ncbi:GTP-binding protein [Bradyrhizobium sp. WYCCWR 13023]|uniref:GTP-binding protein n=1 Tax=Bradyrhizobium zhengyangense TaxID=2911009 RepID=A0A9X1UF81_9BRAD|nr:MULTISPECIES: GTP-binding protein [Bradyrhizobium]MCG2626192.1 GTP-binding protein [Bradyrhizobium zhengyangense]MDA9524496.1 ATP-binding protein [Bradyrhizobium sp. CCBAU 11434]
MTRVSPIPVTVLTGFLGSGKTTVLNQLLRHPGMDGTVAIINEFGEVGLDHLLAETSEERFALLDNGCVCCSVREDLVALLEDLSSREAGGKLPTIRRILIETTGLADPVPVLHTLMTAPGVVARYRIDGVVVTVDTVNALRSLGSYAEAVKQIAVADRILLTKADLADADTIAVVERRIRAINPTVSVIHVNHGSIEPGAVFDAGLFAPHARSEQVASWFVTAAAATAAAHHHDHHTHGSHISSFSLVVNEPIRWEAFSRWLDYVAALKGDDLLRFKALVNVSDRPQGPLVVHAVQHVLHPPIALDAWPSNDRSSRLVFIVRDIPAEAIERTLSRFGEVSRENITRPAA